MVFLDASFRENETLMKDVELKTMSGEGGRSRGGNNSGRSHNGNRNFSNKRND